MSVMTETLSDLLAEANRGLWKMEGEVKELERQLAEAEFHARYLREKLASSRTRRDAHQRVCDQTTVQLQKFVAEMTEGDVTSVLQRQAIDRVH